MDQCVGAAARLPESDRKDLAVLALARSVTVSDLTVQHGVSRKFVYQQTHKARAALDDAFTATTHLRDPIGGAILRRVLRPVASRKGSSQWSRSASISRGRLDVVHNCMFGRWEHAHGS